MFCVNCGAENSAAAGFCIQCGQALGSVAASSVTAAPAAPGPAPPAPAREPSLGKLLGVRTPQIEWGAPAAFLAASILADLAFLLIVPLLRQEGPLPPVSWIAALSGDLLLTAAAVAAFRWVRNDLAAAALASAGYTVVQTVLRVVILQLFVHASPGPPVFIFSLIATFLFLLLLSLAVRCIHPTWLGLWIGATVAQLATSMVYRVGYFLFSRLFEQYSFPFSFGLWDVVQDLLFAAVFAFTFWGGLALFAPKVFAGLMHCEIDVLRD